ncbi:MAG: FecR domain-containing protein [Paludibacter sp.]|nr:FecR domain-containing protein [Paludibacter sp.]
MQTNNKIDIIIVRFLSGKIKSEEKIMLDEWLSESDENKQYMGHIMNLWQSAQPAFRPEDIDLEKATSAVVSKISAIHSHRKWIQSPAIVWWQRIAAVLFIPVILLMGYLLNQDTDFNSKIAHQEIFSPYGVRSKINLPDGSAVWLNSGSQLKYPVNFKSGSRNVSLRGEAFFEVKSDKRNPFVVYTDRLKVEATGTAFNVEAYATDTIVAVTLVHGIVGVNINGKHKLDMQPNQRVSFNNQSNKYQLTQTDPYKWVSWKDGVLAFRDDRLDYVFKKIGLMYNVDISVKDKEIASHLYRATFEGESLDEILNLLKLSAPIKYIHTKRVRSQSGDFSKEKIEVCKK